MSEPRQTPSPAPFRISVPGRHSLPLVFASPHSGRYLPPGFRDLTALDALALRRSEDAFVDTLFGRAPDHGAPLLSATHARIHIDLNRAPDEIDPDMVLDLPADMKPVRTDRVAAGLGLFPRVAGRGEALYRQRLTWSELSARLRNVYAPYHAALAGLMHETRDRFGTATLIDCHSMPGAGAQVADIVLGDRFGASCAPGLTALVERRFAAAGYRVVRNAPYAGGHCTATYGRPSIGFQALQIEIRRDLYMDETALRLHDGAARLMASLDALYSDLAACAAAGCLPRAAE